MPGTNAPGIVPVTSAPSSLTTTFDAVSSPRVSVTTPCRFLPATTTVVPDNSAPLIAGAVDCAAAGDEEKSRMPTTARRTA